jgi:hypothetical protein
VESLIYRNIWLYRALMNVLYKGRYRWRFKRVAELLREPDKLVLELCFGDILLAEFCRRQKKTWIGLDLNNAFVQYAAKRGFDARRADLLSGGKLPSCDVCVMIGSLYHFKPALPELFRRIKAVSGRMILSEPVQNWTNSNAFLRFLACKGTRVGAAEETFRFTETTLLESLDELKTSVGLDYRVQTRGERDMIVEIEWR